MNKLASAVLLHLHCGSKFQILFLNVLQMEDNIVAHFLCLQNFYLLLAPAHYQLRKYL